MLQSVEKSSRSVPQPYHWVVYPILPTILRRTLASAHEAGIGMSGRFLTVLCLATSLSRSRANAVRKRNTHGDSLRKYFLHSASTRSYMQQP